MQQTNQASTTGVSDPTFNLVSILYHALQAAQTYDTYIRDADQHGDTNLAQFLRRLQSEDRNRAQYAMQLLMQRANQGATS
jgi:rubrerythrin